MSFCKDYWAVGVYKITLSIEIGLFCEVGWDHLSRRVIGGKLGLRPHYFWSIGDGSPSAFLFSLTKVVPTMFTIDEELRNS